MLRILARASAFTLTALALASGCSTPSDGAQSVDAGNDGSHPSCALGFLGTQGQPVDLKLIARGADGTSTEIADGARVPLILPPQGGRVVFVGVKATNISACSVTLTGSVRDTSTQQVRVDGRTVNLEPASDGWGSSVDSDSSSFANVPLCPNQWASTDVDEHSFELTVSVSDSAGNAGSKTITVVPFCGEPPYATECACECAKGYVLGQACGDAGK